jgi:hypothetical protein
MKKIAVALLFISITISSCSIFGSKKTGCPVSGAAIGAEQLSDPKASKAASKSKYKGGKKFYK